MQQILYIRKQDTSYHGVTLEANECGDTANTDIPGIFMHAEMFMLKLKANFLFNPTPSADQVIQTWIVDAWEGINKSDIDDSINAAGFNEDPSNWHIYKHDVYGERSQAEWQSTGEM